MTTLSGELVRGDMGVLQPQLVVTDRSIGILELDLAGPDALDLGTEQSDPGLERFDDVVVPPSAAIGGDDLAGFRHEGAEVTDTTWGSRGCR